MAIVQPDEDPEVRWLFVAGESKWIQPERGQDSCLKIGATKSSCNLGRRKALVSWDDEKLLCPGTTKSSCVLGRQKALVSWSNEKLLCPGQGVQFTQYLLSRIFKNSGYDFADKMRFVEEKYLTRSVFENSG